MIYKRAYNSTHQRLASFLIRFRIASLKVLIHHSLGIHNGFHAHSVYQLLNFTYSSQRTFLGWYYATVKAVTTLESFGCQTRWAKKYFWTWEVKLNKPPPDGKNWSSIHCNFEVIASCQFRIVSNGWDGRKMSILHYF